jgi:hypothetical protein
LVSPTLTGVETLQLVANDGLTITSLANALALTSISVSGAANTSITTGSIAINANATVDASAATGNFTLDATGSTGNGYAIKGSAGINIITGGNAPISVDINKSATKSDVIAITAALGSSISVPETITGFLNATSIGDKLDVIGTATITANVAAGTSTGVTNLTGTLASGVLTFAGTAASSATLTDKVNAAFSANFLGTTQYNVLAFEDSGSTYLVEQGDTTAAYSAGNDLIVKLTGVTGVTALSTTVSGVSTLWVV